MSETSDQKSTVPNQRKRKKRRMMLGTTAVTEAYSVLKAQASRQEQDEFAGQYHIKTAGQAENTIIEPMYSPNALNRYAMASGVLRTCIDAMATNIDGFGYTLEYIGPEEQRDSAEVQDERNRVAGFLDHPNGDYSLIAMRKRFRVDREATGYGAFEIVRNPDDGFPELMYHMPAHTLRMTTQDREDTEVMKYLPRPGSRSDNMHPIRRNFRRAVQIVSGKPVYFKESGDPRDIDKDTGKPAGEDTPDVKLATEVLMDHQYAPGGRYGAPRWIGDLRSVLGIQESENVNLGYFKDNGIPAMMVFVLGGALSEEGMDQFEESIRAGKGQAMQQKVALIEVTGDPQASSDEGTINRPDIKVQSLMRERQQDAFFQEFEKNAAKKIRSSFRLPSLFTGLSEEVRHAVAEASMTVAENQVFGPERTQTDDLFNYHILTYNGEPMRFWRFRSNPPKITSEQSVLDALEVFDAVGAMTPNVAIGIANEMFDMSIPAIEEDWGNEPFAWTLNEEPVLPDDGTGEGGEGGNNVVALRRARPNRRRKRHRDARRVRGDDLKVKASPKPNIRVRRRSPKPEDVVRSLSGSNSAPAAQTPLVDEADD